MICLIRFTSTPISGINHPVVTRICHIGHGKSPCPWTPLKSLFLRWFTPCQPFSLFLVLNSTITYEHLVKSSHSTSPCHNQKLTLSTVYTKYSIHRVQHTPSTAYTEYSIHRVQHTASTAYTEYSIHRVQHTPNTAYTNYSIHQLQHTPTTAYTNYSIHHLQHTQQYCIHEVLHHHKIDCLSLPASFLSLCRPSCTQCSTLPQIWVNQ